MSKGGLDDRLAVFNKLFPGSNAVGLEFIEGVFCGLKIVTLGIKPVSLCSLILGAGLVESFEGRIGSAVGDSCVVTARALALALALASSIVSNRCNELRAQHKTIGCQQHPIDRHW